MKPRPEYFRELLRAFEDSEDPTIDIYGLESKGLSYKDPEFYFHMRLLTDQGFVEREDGEPGLGIQTVLSGNHTWSVIPLRLTASGYEFAEAMDNPVAFDAVKKSLVTSSLSVMRDIAVAALKAHIGLS